MSAKIGCGARPVSIHRLARPAVSLTFSHGSDCAMERRWDRVIAVQCNQSLKSGKNGHQHSPIDISKPHKESLGSSPTPCAFHQARGDAVVCCGSHPGGRSVDGETDRLLRRFDRRKSEQTNRFEPGACHTIWCPGVGVRCGSHVAGEGD